MEKNVLEKIKEQKDNFRDSEEKVANYILAHWQDVLHLPITELAERIGVSEATIVRMCKKLGLRGFQELKIALATEKIQPIKTIHQAVQEGDDLETILKKVFSANIRAMESTLNVISVKEIERAIEAILNARQLQIYGVGGSGPVALDAQHKFMKTGIPTVAYVDSHMMAMSASILEPQDVVIGISASGSSKDIIDALELAKNRGATTIGITHYARTPLDRVLDIKLSVSSEETFYRTESTSARIAQLSIIDTLYIGVALRRLDKIIENLKLTREAIVPKRF
ncbi:MurR/RpiR family transcriptional regulator [Dictyoglomus thermophilum]|uniref:Transcriptional regulator n=2 Tax=Dictyoglomus thermophilum TaxID=14 RepID=B5YAK8_DICT6|nr:MurR/RpiR family transcriptional regulator [Dictyoglomus thermophilum]ACI18455.1 transcriptional regulator [Dictyoglomus thermophilum H-6-12]MCX7720534.1 MurR/RpiR family transcriptional regulator [Dictyoglomus thermophilum]TYT24309.1 MurR/RpiR family transcriptional regulator [Dictyoglomus thermophilum]